MARFCDAGEGEEGRRGGRVLYGYVLTQLKNTAMLTLQVCCVLRG